MSDTPNPAEQSPNGSDGAEAASDDTEATDTVVAEPHLIEMLPVEPLGDQYVLSEPSLTLP